MNEKYATLKHAEAGKKYDGFDYLLHLRGVVVVAERYVDLYFNSDQAKVLIQACWSHDLIEDCGLNYNDLSKDMSSEVADIVYDVSNELGKNRKERNAKTYLKIKNSKSARFVKLCDRIANTLYSYYSGSSMHKLYRSELEEFKKNLQVEGEFVEMWEELDKLSNL